MAAPNPGTREEIRAHRQEHHMDGDSLNKSTRVTQQFNESLYINLTQYAVDTFDIEKEDELRVETFTDRIEIRPLRQQPSEE